MPNLLHPIPVFLRQIEKEKTSRMDDNLREPIGAVDRPSEAIKLMGQIKWHSQDMAVATHPGSEERSSGYILFKSSDLKREHVILNIGDKVVRIGKNDKIQDVDLYFIKFEPIAHTGSGNHLTKAHFQDRQPSAHRIG